MELHSLPLLAEALRELEQGFAELPDVEYSVDVDSMRAVLLEVAGRMHGDYPFHHPLYAGQMLKPPHPIARLAYALSLWINPNNHALDGGRTSSRMEKECVADIARMFGWDTHLGHLCGGGTMANLEALWVAGQTRPGLPVLASSQAHYTHGRISNVLGLGFEPLPVDARGRMRVDALEARLGAVGAGTVVATLGTTGTGSVDPLADILSLKDRYDFRVHVDAAYGGYFRLVDNLDADARAAFDCIDAADSIVVDPHKHGLQPYGCGCVLFRDPQVGRIYKHDSPYTYFSSDDLHLGEISLECSRAGASAVALWATMRLLPLELGGDFARQLAAGREAALELHARLDDDDRFLTIMAPELDIVVWAPAGRRASEISARASTMFDAAAREHLHLALMSLPASFLAEHWPHVDFDDDAVTCLRSCLMKPEHREWMDRIWATIDTIAND
ncbi:MAG: aminotransferase class I/II-fold pyridoxal phosphate-dependent enzyme [Gammaproteobacteria bacterium]|nr:aminotransferase class I/II-fold pyridoxal phosphate-dependent enzyme [Gammaproteobacteria bacterium]